MARARSLGKEINANDIVRRGEDKGDSKTGEETLVGGSEGRRGGGQGACHGSL